MDCDLEDRNTLVSSLRAGVRLVDLNKKEDGLNQILNYLRVNRGVRVIHLISHGSAGKLELGKIALTHQNIRCYESTLAQIGSLLAANAELHIYGCELASNDDGLTFVKQLAALTGCSVAASKTLTGAKSLGGDWNLEVELGQITAPLAFEAAMVDRYTAVLGPFIAPANENFDGISGYDGSTQNNAIDVAGWTFTTTNSPTTFVVGGNNDYLGLLNSSPTDYSLVFNAFESVTTFIIKSTDGSEFKLNSFDVAYPGGISNTVTVYGWRDVNTLVGQETFPLFPGTNGPQVGTVRLIDVSSNPDFANIDEIRFSFSEANAIAEIDDLNISLAVLPPPTVTDARISITGASGTAGAYKIGDIVTATWNNTAGGDNNSEAISGVTMNFSQFGGGAAVVATNSSGTWTASYTITSGAISASNRNVSVSATSNNGTTTTADTTNATVDNVTPAVASVSVPSNGTYRGGQNLDFTVNFGEAVTVTGTPQIAITLDTGGTVNAAYISGSGTAALLFRYTVATGNADPNGISVDTLSTNGGSIRDAAGNNATLTLNNVGSTAAIFVDAIDPTTPSAPNMTPGSDSGLSSTDDITSDTTPTVTGTAEVNSTVTLYDTDGTTVLGNTTADGAGNWSITSSALAPGMHVLTAKAADAAGNVSSASSGLAITVDASAPTASVTTASITSGSTVTTAQSSETGRAYLVSTSATVTDLASLDALVTANSATQATVSVANTDTTLSTTGLAAGTYAIYTVDSAGNVSGASTNRITVSAAPAGGDSSASEPFFAPTIILNNQALLRSIITTSSTINGGFGNSITLSSSAPELPPGANPQMNGPLTAIYSFAGNAQSIAGLSNALANGATASQIAALSTQLATEFGSLLLDPALAISTAVLQSIANRFTTNSLASTSAPGAAPQSLAALPTSGEQLYTFYALTDFTGSNQFGIAGRLSADHINVLLIKNTAGLTQTVDLSSYQGVAAVGAGVNVSGLTLANLLIAEGYGTYQLGGTNQQILLNGPGATILGGTGVDTVRFAGVAQSAAQITHQDGQLRVQASWDSRNSGLTMLDQVDRLAFSDGSLAFDAARGEHAGQIYRLYDAAFNRGGDAAGIGYWLYQLDRQASLVDIAHGFIQSQEFASLYGTSLNNARFIEALYQNVLGRTPDAEGYQYWLSTIDRGAGRENLLISFSESAESVGNSAPLLINGVAYHNWTPL